MPEAPRSWRSRSGALLTVAALAVGMGLVPTQGQADLRIATAVAARGNPDAYNFTAKVNGVPIHWNKCDRIGFRVYTRDAPRRGIAQAREAVSRLNKASGLRFVYQGRSQAKPSQYDRYARDTKLVVGWTAPRRSPIPFGGAAGYGGVSYSSTGEILNGFALLNSAVKLAPGFGRGPREGVQGTIGQVLMHELGHAVGLDHVGNQPQIMYGTATRKPATWGAGDRNGLVRVGKQRRCF
jgi:hypothetical protein